MRRMLAVLVTLAGLTASLEAQTCRGLAPLPAGRLQATGSGMVSAGYRAMTAELLYDLPAEAFGGVSLGTTAVEAFEKSSLDLGANLGYQLELAPGSQARLCPLATTTLQVGPNNAFGSGVGRSTFSAAVGLSAGTLLRLKPGLSVVPAVSLGLGYRIHQANSSTGVRLLRIGETFGFAQAHAGFVVNEHLSIRPTVEIPLGLNGGDLGVGVTVGYHFGRRHPGLAEP